MKIWRTVGKTAFKVGKSVLEDPKARDKIVSTGRKIWESPTVQAKKTSLLGRLKGKSKPEVDKNQTRMF